jgi:nucleotide-binding universal stress UspA family protein
MFFGSEQTIGSVFHPTDFTNASNLAFNHALRIALSNRSQLDILHVGSNGEAEADWFQVPQVRKTLEQWQLLEPGSPRKAVAEKLGIKVRKVDLRSRSPRAAIKAFLEGEPADLIVLATHGREGPPRWLKPSVSEPVARDAKTATLFIPHGARGFVTHSGEVRLDRVLMPVDQKPDPQPAIEAMALFLRSIDARPSLVETLFVGQSSRMPNVMMPDSLDCAFESSARSGKPVDEIIKLAAEQQVELIVMATEGHDGFLDALRGSTTEQVLRRAPCPVLAIPTQAR